MSESFGKYREWQHWLSIWAQLFSSLVETHKHMNTMTEAHTYTAVSGLGVLRRRLNSALHTCRRWNCTMQVQCDMKPCLENRSFCRWYSIWSALFVIAPMYQYMRPVLVWQPVRFPRWWSEKWNYAQNNPVSCHPQKRLLVPGVFCETEAQSALPCYLIIIFMPQDLFWRSEQSPPPPPQTYLFTEEACERQVDSEATGTCAWLCAGVCTTPC